MRRAYNSVLKLPQLSTSMSFGDGLEILEVVRAA